MTTRMQIDFDPGALVLDPVRQAQQAIQREEWCYQAEYNARAKELMQIRSELAACLAVERELPQRIARLTRELDLKLKQVQKCLSDAARKGYLLQVGKEKTL
jgi:hypothetical protein